MPEEGWKTWSRCPAIRELQEQVAGGHCIFCKRTVEGRRRPRLICDGEACSRAYNLVYVRWQRLERVRAGLTERGEETKYRSERERMRYEELRKRKLTGGTTT